MKLKTISKLALTFIVMAVLTRAAFAQNTEGRPTALLVMLISEQNRLKFAQDHNRGRELEEIKKDAANVVRVTKNDFRDHFHYCPVYYFMDSNMSKIKEHKFENVVTNADGTPASIPHNFVIAYYGLAMAYKNDVRWKKGIVIVDQNMQQIAFKAKSAMSLFFRRKDRKAYTYTSKHYDIDYKAIAGDLQSYIDK